MYLNVVLQKRRRRRCPEDMTPLQLCTMLVVLKSTSEEGCVLPDWIQVKL